jgi:uncharacterized protein YdaU (DUF1376 family)
MESGVILNYYERYCGDYQRDTAHLSLAEHGAYTMLLDTYFSVEKPLPSDLPSLYRVCRAMSRLEQQAVRSIAEQFFPVSQTDGLRHNQRADREIAKARPKIEAARINGRKGGRPPKLGASDFFQAARQETLGMPDGLSVGSTNLTDEILPDEPGGKAHQPQHQHQLQHQSGKGTNKDIPAIGLPEDHRCNPHPESNFALSFTSENGDCLNASSHSESFHSESFHIEPPEPKTSHSVPPGTAGTCCKALVHQGVQGCNPHHPVFLALLQAGAMEEEFVQAARNAVARGKASFAYVVGTVKRQREEAAKLVLHHGRMPNGQELLESSNKAAAKGWLPPELRAGETRSTEQREIPHAN